MIQAGPIGVARCESADVEVKLKEAKASSPFGCVPAFCAACFLTSGYGTASDDEADKSGILAFVFVLERCEELGQNECRPQNVCGGQESVQKRASMLLWNFGAHECPKVLGRRSRVEVGLGRSIVVVRGGMRAVIPGDGRVGRASRADMICVVRVWRSVGGRSLCGRSAGDRERGFCWNLH